MTPRPGTVCDWCDHLAVVSNPEMGNLCRGCLAGGDDGHHYQLRHEPLLSACFAVPSARLALERLRVYLAANTTVTDHGSVLDAAISDGTAEVFIEQGVCVPVRGDENVQLTTCFCDTPLEP